MTQPSVNTHKGGLARFVEALELDVRLLGMLGAMLIIWVIFNYFAHGSFLTPRNLWNLAVQTSVVGIIATAMVPVIVTRQIDLSVGSVLGFTGMIMAAAQARWFTANLPLDWVWGLIIGILAGGLIGAFQGFWVAYQGVPSFIVTLAGLLIFRGGAWLVTQGQTVAPLDEAFQQLGSGSIGGTASWVVGGVAIAAVIVGSFRSRQKRLRLQFPVKPLWADALLVLVTTALIVGFVMLMNAYMQPRSNLPRGIPVPVLITLTMALLMSYVMRRTRFGRYVYSLGGNPEATALAGVDTKRVKLWIFIIIGMMSAVAGAIASARLNAGANSTGTLTELYVIAAVVIGGTSLAGGYGTILGAMLGALLMQSLQSGMVLIGLSSPLQQIVIGLVLIIAVWIDILYRRRSGVETD